MLNLAQLRIYAVARHGDQLYGAQPYSVHLDAVHDLAVLHGLGSAYERAAFGHDLIDDTDAEMAELAKKFGAEEAAIIYSVSGPGENRAARRQETLRRLAEHPRGIDLKAVDRIANLRNALTAGNRKLVAMYLGEQLAYAPYFALAKPSLQVELAELYGLATTLLLRA